MQTPPSLPKDAARAGRAPSVLRHAHYRNIWAAAFVSNVGGWMEAVGVQWVMKELTVSPQWTERGGPNAMTMLGYLALAQLGPTLVLGLLGGLLADRVNRKRLLLATQTILMVIASVLAFASSMDGLTPSSLLILGLINGIALAFNVPAWQVLTPRLVPREELTRAINLNGVQFNLARVIGPAVGGALMAAWGPTVLFIANAASFIAVLVAVTFTPDAPAPPKGGVPAWRQIGEALRFVMHQRGPRAIFVGTVIFSTLAGPLLRMLPLFVSQVHRRSEDTYGFLLALMGCGAVAGGLSLRLIPPWYPKHHFIPLAVTVGGISLILFSATSVLWCAAVLIVACGACWMWSFNSSMAAMQLLVDDAMRGRVLAICNTAVFGAMPMGSLIAAAIGDALGGRTADGLQTGASVQLGVGAMAGVLAVAGLVMLIWRTPEVDGIKPGEPGYDRRPSLLAGITGSAHRPRP